MLMIKNSQSVRDYFLALQNKITEKLQEQETVSFIEDKWKREEGGGGQSRILENGDIFEKAGINFSDVQGKHLPASATNKRPNLENASFRAMGISLVFHPRNPFVPTCHMNLRFFSVMKDEEEITWWFGGGYDLTPYYGFEEDAIHWHRTAHEACEPFGQSIYPEFKKACDRYFYLPHRNEPRGIGGIFFDDYNKVDFQHSFALTQSVGNSFLPAYMPIVEKRKNTPFNDSHKKFQHYRRGRYVEFNLVYDRGTLFGLQSNGRTESILMSLPPQVNWTYDYKPDSNSEEALLYQNFLIEKDWLK
ncbi:MAG: Oxygen-dependent coproporphyrinogen-III oxidase [Puniceicoccaceae bacterium MED-G32]|jgi:coproporphyrinogen III oxidase|nr:MAG: Oxygen-dependent coproporphyrinogen-III oxidase [Puniceicoccaceae bacterium MED-G32]|tara:strand:+ start:1048 stop:1959 length:912 start_codon:yes stop_codon:yes gene_type:complete